jgi:hypothetical protein
MINYYEGLAKLQNPWELGIGNWELVNLNIVLKTIS